MLKLQLPKHMTRLMIYKIMHGANRHSDHKKGGQYLQKQQKCGDGNTTMAFLIWVF